MLLGAGIEYVSHLTKEPTHKTICSDEIPESLPFWPFASPQVHHSLTLIHQSLRQHSLSLLDRVCAVKASEVSNPHQKVHLPLQLVPFLECKL